MGLNSLIQKRNMLNGETLADGVFNVNPRSNRDICAVTSVVKLVDRKVVKIQCHTVLESSYFNRRLFVFSMQFMSWWINKRWIPFKGSDGKVN